MSEEEKPEVRIQLNSGHDEIKTITLSSSINIYILTIFALQFTSVMTALGAEVTTFRASPIRSTSQYGYLQLNSARSVTIYLFFAYIWTFGFVLIFSLLGFIKYSRSFFKFLIVSVFYKFTSIIDNRSFNRSFLVLRCIVFCRLWSRFITTLVYASNFSE